MQIILWCNVSNVAWCCLCSPFLLSAASGKLYSCGMNTGGQLGIGRVSNEMTDYKFHLVSALSSTVDSSSNRVVQLDCGADHSMALTAKGQVCLLRLCVDNCSFTSV